MGKNNLFGFLALGQAGGNQVYQIDKTNLFDCYYINSNKDDLDILGDISSFLIPDVYGTHKDRQVSKQYLANHVDEILSNINKYLPQKYIFIFAGLAGGTGGGSIGYIIDLLQNELGKVCIAVGTVPRNNEPIQALVNAYECLQEIIKINKATTFLIDNEKNNNFEITNKTFAENLIILLTDIGKSKDGNWDLSEILMMLELKGYSVLNRFKRQTSKYDATKNLIAAVENNILADIESKNLMYYSGIRYSAMKKTVGIDFELYKEVFGHCRDLFQGYQTKYDFIMMSGLNYPMTRINALYDCIQSENVKIKEETESIHQCGFKNDYNIFGNIKPQTILVDDKTLSARDQLLRMKQLC